MTDLIEIEYKLLIEDKTNYRRSMDRSKLEALKHSIREHGVMQNLEVQDIPGSDQKAVIIGNRRLRAVGELITELSEELGQCKDAQQRELLQKALDRILKLNCRVLQGEAAKHAKERQLVENLQREEISPVDEAFGYEDLRKNHGLTIEEISKRVGMDKTPQYVSNRLKLLRVPKRLLDALQNGTPNITIRMCERVGRIPSKQDREEVAEKILNPKHYDEPLRDPQVEQLIREHYVVPIKEGGFDPADEKLLPLQKDAAGHRLCGGSCVDCPFRTGNDPTLADELATGNDGKRGKKSGVDPQLCTNVGGCFSLKVDAAWEVMKKKAKDEGNVAMDLNQAKQEFKSYGGELAYNSPFVDLNDKPSYNVLGHYDDEKIGKWDKLLEGTGIKITFARHPVTKRIHRLVDRATAVDAVNAKAKAAGKPSPFAKRSQQSAQQSEAEKKKKAAERDKSQLEWATTYEMMQMVSDAVAQNGINEDRAQKIAEIAIGLADHDGQFVMCKALNLEPEKGQYAKDYGKPLVKHVTALKGAQQKLGFAVLAMTMRYAKHSPTGTTDFNVLAKAYEIDRKSAEAIAKAKLQEKKKPKKEKEKLTTVTRSSAVERNHAALQDEEKSAAKKKGKK